MFNVTVLGFSKTSRIPSQLSDTLHMIEYPEHPFYVYSNRIERLVLMDFDIETDFTEGRNKVLPQIIRDSKFDVGIAEIFHHQTVIMKLFDLPLVKFNNLLTDAVLEPITF